MSEKIFRAILLAVAGTLLATMVILLGFLYDYFGGVEKTQLWQELDMAAAGVESSGMDYFGALESGGSRLTWIAADGSVLYDEQADQSVMENHADREEVREALENGTGSSTRYSGTLLEKTVYCAKRLSNGSVLRVSVATASIGLLLLGMLQPLCLVALVVLGLAFFLARRSARRIVEPLNKLDLDCPQETETYTEIAPLLERIRRQRRQIDEQLRIRQEFTANVSHELKTPLTTILAGSEMIENGMVAPEDTPRFVGHIHEEAARLLTLIEDIIRLSQLDEGAELPMETVDLAAVTEEAAEQLRGKAESGDVTLDVQAEACPLQGVPRLFHEIVYNLTENAIKYNRPGGSVTVTVTRSGALTVDDTGIGIAPEHQGRVFERFYRVDKSHSRAIGGTGLGLSIVKHACVYLGAWIELESEVGKGTTIRVRFKAANPTPRQENP